MRNARRSSLFVTAGGMLALFCLITGNARADGVYSAYCPTATLDDNHAQKTYCIIFRTACTFDRDMLRDTALGRLSEAQVDRRTSACIDAKMEEMNKSLPPDERIRPTSEAQRRLDENRQRLITRNGQLRYRPAPSYDDWLRQLHAQRCATTGC